MLTSRRAMAAWGSRIGVFDIRSAIYSVNISYEGTERTADF